LAGRQNGLFDILQLNVSLFGGAKAHATCAKVAASTSA
jgi:hypothetical protein